LDRVWVSVHDVVHQRLETVSPELERALHKTVKKVTEDIEAFKFNTAISSMMILMNEWDAHGGGSKEFAGTLVRLLSPFAPHLAEEMWELLGNAESIALASWPSYDPTLIKDSTVSIVVQINGKLRDRIDAAAGLSEEEAKAIVMASPKVSSLIVGKKVVKMIYVQDKLINLVLE
jgi:leucyl-tRNA synthetase